MAKSRTSIYISKENEAIFEKIESYATHDTSIATITFEAYKLWLKKQKRVA